MVKRKEILVEKKHWDNIYDRNLNAINYISNLNLFRSYYHFVLFSIISRFIKGNNFKNVIEIGCAPGNYLVKFKKEFHLETYGVEYSKNGYHKTLENIKKYDISSDNIFLNDFFDKDFLETNKEKYDLVFSTGFIEHFDSPENIINNQTKLTRKGGLVICLIPNKIHLNALFSTEKSLSMHNLKIMNIDSFRNIFEKNNLLVLYCNYIGGIFNIGLFQAKNSFVKILAFIVLILQRLFLDNFQKIYFKITGKDLVSKYSSPSLICIARKK